LAQERSYKREAGVHAESYGDTNEGSAISKLFSEGIQKPVSKQAVREGLLEAKCAK